jgi:hypothetical protein
MGMSENLADQVVRPSYEQIRESATGRVQQAKPEPCGRPQTARRTTCDE